MFVSCYLRYTAIFGEDSLCTNEIEHPIYNLLGPFPLNLFLNKKSAYYAFLSLFLMNK